MQSLRGQVKPDITPEQLGNIQTSFSAELREYSEKTHQRIQRLRNDVQAASHAVEVFVRKFSASGTDLDVEVKRELQTLDKASRTASLDDLRKVISDVSAGIASSFERVRSSNQLAIAQLKDEIRVLQQEIEIARKSRPTGGPSMTSLQRETFQQIDSVRLQNTPFSVILVGAKNVRGLQSCYSKTAIESALASLGARLQHALPRGSTTSRWAEAQFVAIVTVDPPAAMAMSRDLAKQLSGTYVVQDGAFKSVAMEATAGVIDWKPQGDPSALHRRLEQLSEALARD
jgi:GGDEF domain-containing protein